jgi:hypothetical protein
VITLVKGSRENDMITVKRKKNEPYNSIVAHEVAFLRPSPLTVQPNNLVHPIPSHLKAGRGTLPLVPTFMPHPSTGCPARRVLFAGVAPPPPSSPEVVCRVEWRTVVSPSFSDSSRCVCTAQHRLGSGPRDAPELFDLFPHWDDAPC